MEKKSATLTKPAAKKKGAAKRVPVAKAKKKIAVVGIAKRVSDRRLVEADLQSKRVPLAAERAVLYLEALLKRARVRSRRGHTDPPTPLTISVLEEQALQECLALLQLKVVMQRGALPVRSREG